MYNETQTTVTEFLLLGIQNLKTFKYVYFVLLFVFYFVTISGNLLIIWLVTANRSLHTPMYFFLTQLSTSDVLMATNITPNTLSIVLKEKLAMSFAGCISQFFFFCMTICVECLILTAMAYDRYLAICYPLRYNSLINLRLCSKLAIISWIISFSLTFIDTITISQLRFCGHNVIDHFFCDLVPLLELACSDTSIVQIEVLIFCIPVVLFPLIVIPTSYIYIVLAILKISSESGRQKAFSTCSSHLTVVCLFYGTILAIYMLPNKGKSLTISKVMSLLYTVLTPMSNPIIYSLRNNDIKEVIKMAFKLN
ncbi:olfactory receptor 1468-like [Pelobates fuscus]|uniref:olfactory receptor 1468-like n=1 Tax=Pelobates fuscus TaxID=191477 RepID=UPI002FE42E65